MKEKSLWAYFKDAFTKDYVNFSGRARRREYWGFVLYYNVILLLLWILGILLFAPVGDLFNPQLGSALIWLSVIFPGGVLAILFALAFFLPGLAILVRRFHDVGLSGKWLLAMYIFQLVVTYLPLFFIFLGNDAEDIVWLSRGLSPAVSLLCFVVLIVVTCKDSQVEPNKWGENPKFSSEV